MIRTWCKDHPIQFMACYLVFYLAFFKLLEQGIQVPQQISLMGENNSSFCETCRPRLTSLDTMVSMSSIMAARTLLDVLEGREPSHHVTLQMTIVERGTT